MLEGCAPDRCTLCVSRSNQPRPVVSRPSMRGVNEATLFTTGTHGGRIPPAGIPVADAILQCVIAGICWLLPTLN